MVLFAYIMYKIQPQWLTLAFNLLSCAASGSFWPSHQESPDPGPADPKPGYEGSDWCLYPGERLGGRLLKGPAPPPMSSSYPSTQHKTWMTQDYREQITPCLDMYFTQAGKATLWTTTWEPCISVWLFLPTFYLCCKSPRSYLLRLDVHGLLLPLKPPSFCSF